MTAHSFMRGLNPDTRELVQAALDAGWKAEKTNGGHIRLLPADRNVPVQYVASTPNMKLRGVKNERARLRRAGLPV